MDEDLFVNGANYLIEAEGVIAVDVMTELNLILAPEV